MQRWSNARYRREFHEQRLAPDERLDETGWDIFYCAVARDDMVTAARRTSDEGLTSFYALASERVGLMPRLVSQRNAAPPRVSARRTSAEKLPTPGRKAVKAGAELATLEDFDQALTEALARASRPKR
jgi:hypothetical protein